MRITTRIITFFIFVACLAWFTAEGGFEPLITASSCFLAFLSTFFYSDLNHEKSNYRDIKSVPNQIPLNTDPKLPILLLIETSSSMEGERINTIKMGIESLYKQIISDEISSKRVDLALVTFGSSTTISRDFVPINKFSVPDFILSGGSRLGEGIDVSLKLLNQRKNLYHENGIAYYKPFFFVLTDGNPTDNWRYSLNELHKQVSLKNLNFILVGLSNSSIEVLQEASGGNAITIKLQDLNFMDLFSWFVSSINVVSQNKNFPLPPSKM